MKHKGLTGAGAAVVVVVGVLFAWSFVDPSLNVPVVSPIVCRLKGDIFYDEPNVWIGVEAPGCYRRPASKSPNGSGSSTTPRTGPSDQLALPDQTGVMDAPLWHPRDRPMLAPDLNHDGLISEEECAIAGGHFARSYGNADGWRQDCYSGAAD